MLRDASVAMTGVGPADPPCLIGRAVQVPRTLLAVRGFDERLAIRNGPARLGGPCVFRTAARPWGLGSLIGRMWSAVEAPSSCRPSVASTGGKANRGGPARVGGPWGAAAAQRRTRGP